MPWSPAPSSSPPFFFLAFDAHGDVGRLAVQQHLDVGAVIGEAVLVVADVLDHAAGDLGDQLAIDHRHAVDGPEQLAAAFAGDHDLVGGAERLAAQPGVDLAVVGDAELDVLLDEGIENGIGNLVGNLVRMTLGHGFTGEEEVGARHRGTLLKRAGLGPRRTMLRGFCSVLERGQDVGSRGQTRRWWPAGRVQALSSPAICSTRSTIRRRSLASLMPMKALVSARPSEVARKSET